MSSFLSRINSKTGQVLNLNPDNPQPVSINNGLIVSGTSTFENSLSVSQRVGTEGYIYNSLTAGVEDIITDLRVVNKRIQPDRNAIVRKLGTYTPIDSGTVDGNSIAYSEELKLFVIAADGTTPRISSDGINWTAPNSFTTSMVNPAICWSPELSLFVVGNGDSTNQPFQTNSTPASTAWSIKPISPLAGTYIIYSIVWSAELSLFVATTDGNTILTSSNGSNWTRTIVSFITSPFKHNLVWASELGIFVLSASSSVRYSYNGITWFLASGVSASYMVAWSPTVGHFVSTFIGDYHTSRDGINWTSRGTSLANNYVFKWVDDLEMFIGQDDSINTIYSYDGINWNILSTITIASDIVWSKELSILILISRTNPGVYLYGPILPSVGSSLLTNPSYISINNTTGNLTVANSAYLSLTSGSVGIGNNSPGYKLDVTGTGRFTDTFSLSKTTGNSLVVSSTSSSNSSIIGNSISTLGGIGITGNSFFSSTTDSSSSTTGSVVFSGGLGIAKQLFVGTNATIGTSAVGTLSLPNTTTSGTVLLVSNATDSSSNTTGSVTLAGGLGIAKQLFVGTNATIGTSAIGTLSLPNTTTSGTVLVVSNATDSTTSTSGSVTLAGGLGVAKNIINGGYISARGSLPNSNSIAGTYIGMSGSNSCIELNCLNTTDSPFIDFTSLNTDLDGRIIYNLSSNIFDIQTGGNNTRLSIGDTRVSVDITTASTTTTTGALVVSGGAGIAGNITSGSIDATNSGWSYIGADINGIAISGSRRGFGFGWNQSGGQGESILTYFTGGGGSSPRLDLCSWDGTTRSVRMTMDNIGNTVFNGILYPFNGLVVQNTQNGGAGRGIYMWERNDSNWAIYMSTSGAGASISGNTAVASPGFSSHSIRFRSIALGSNGFIFENSDELHLMSIKASTAEVFMSGSLRLSVNNTDGGLLGSFFTPNLSTNLDSALAVGKSTATNGSIYFRYVNAAIPYGSLGFFGNDDIIYYDTTRLVTILGSFRALSDSSPYIASGTTNGGDGGMYFGNTSHGIIRGPGNNNITLYTNGGGTILIPNQVIIGSSTVPFRTLDVENSLRIKGANAIIDFGTGVDIQTYRSGNDLLTGSANGTLQYYTNSTLRMNIANNGAITIPGSLSKGSGTFDIQHPTIPEKRLVHSFVEGPRCDLIYRGTTVLINGQVDVNLDKECTNKKENSMTEGTFIALCSNPVKYLHNNSSFSRVIGSISGNILTITCEDSQSSDTIDWMVIAERKDTFIKDWTRTDGDGELITQYNTPN